MNMSSKTADLPLHTACFACSTNAEMSNSPGRGTGTPPHHDIAFIYKYEIISVNYTFETREIVCKCLVIPLGINVTHSVLL